MLDHSAGYAKGIIGTSRRLYARAEFDLSDPDLVVSSVTGNDLGSYSIPTQLGALGKVPTAQLSATLEENYWKLDGSFPLQPTTATARAGHVGWEGGSKISGANGVFSTAPYVTMNFTGVDHISILSVVFSEYDPDGVADTFTVEVYSGSTMVESRTITGNRDKTVVVEGLSIYNPSSIKLTISKWSMPGRRARVRRLLAGAFMDWTGDDIQAIDIYSEVSFAGTALPYSTCDITIFNGDHRFDPYNPNGIFTAIESRQAVRTFIGLGLEDGTTEWLPSGVYYQQDEGWVAKGLGITWKLLDIIGALIKRRFVVPSALPTTLAGWVEAITASLGTNFRKNYIVDSSVSSRTLKSTKAAVEGRNCGDLLRFACMATNTWASQDMETGYLKISTLRSKEGNAIIADNMSDWPDSAAGADVSDITFQLDTGEVTFPGNNSESTTSLVIKNPFVHTQTEASNALQSVMRSYGGRTFDVKHRGNPSSETGDIQTVETRYGSTITARLYRQQLKIANGVMRDVPSYLVQSPYDSPFANRVVLTGSGTWTSPSKSVTVRITLVGGGQGGTGGGGGVLKSSGYGGHSSMDAPDTAGGEGGQGGEIKVVTVGMNASQGYSYRCGSGGAGGAGGKGSTSTSISRPGEDGQPGGMGGASTFDIHTSAGGAIYANGLMNVQTGATYGLPGKEYPQEVQEYGAGGMGGKPGSNGVEYYDKQGYSEIRKKPEDGTAGSRGNPGCIILEW